MNEQQEREFLAKVRVELDRSTDDLDDLTVARLRAARRRALDARPRRFGWLAAAGIAATAVAAGLMAVALWTPVTPPASGFESIELLGEADVDFYENLDFYHWLAENRQNG
jgi:hypothetical protein